MTFRSLLLIAVPGGLLPCDILRGQDSTMLPVPESHRGLEKLGVLRLESFSIHGLAPLVVLFTEAGASAPESQRRFRAEVTRRLTWDLDRLHASLFTLRRRWNAQNAAAAFAILRRLPPGLKPQVIIGFGDGATAAAHLLVRDSLGSALLALAPGSSNTGADQAGVWEELLRPVDNLRPVLVLESDCNLKSSLTQVGYRKRQTVLILPQYDNWLVPKKTSTCPESPQQASGLDYQVLTLILEWLQRTLHYPQ